LHDIKGITKDYSEIQIFSKDFADALNKIRNHPNELPGSGL
jgi:hypothetical protein